MKPPVDTIRLGKQSRDQLVKIKRSTGIENWNNVSGIQFENCKSSGREAHQAWQIALLETASTVRELALKRVLEIKHVTFIRLLEFRRTVFVDRHGMEDRPLFTCDNAPAVLFAQPAQHAA